MNGVRLDKWLWAARFYKTRSLAAKACELGRVLSKGQPVKAAREAKVGDRLQVTTESGAFEVDVLALSEVRGPAPEAQKLYHETEESKVARAKEAEIRRMNREFTPAPIGRPSKKDRRRIIQFRGER